MSLLSRKALRSSGRINSEDVTEDLSLEPSTKRLTSDRELEFYPRLEGDELHQIVWLRRERSEDCWVVFGADECQLLERSRCDRQTLVFLSLRSRQRRVDLHRMVFESRRRARARWSASPVLRVLFPVSLGFSKGDRIPAGSIMMRSDMRTSDQETTSAPSSWQRGTDLGLWKTFSRGLSRTLETAFSKHPDRLHCFTVAHINYSFDFSDMHMVRADKEVLAIFPIMRSSSEVKVSEVPWRSDPVTVTQHWTKHSVLSSSLSLQESRETHEYLFAAGIFSKFAGISLTSHYN